MSWIDEREIVYLYKLENGETRKLALPVSFSPEETCLFEDGLEGKYVGFEPEVVKQTNVVEYDKHGRKALRIKDKNGNLTHISKSKYNYMKTGKVVPQHTKAYQEHLIKTNQHEFLKSEVETRQRKQTVAAATFQETEASEKVGQLPDGEYLTNGRDFVPFKKPNEKGE